MREKEFWGRHAPLIAKLNDKELLELPVAQQSVERISRICACKDRVESEK